MKSYGRAPTFLLLTGYEQVRSVVAALWPIEDAATARFMNEFYRAYRESGRAADALRAAQLRTRGHTSSSVWASFVVRANGFP